KPRTTEACTSEGEKTAAARARRALPQRAVVRRPPQQNSEWQLGGVSAAVCVILPPLHTTLVWQSARMCPSVC
ncbi:hypothetical protein WUBG_05403, partial [Wuchereria bancrofti]